MSVVSKTIKYLLDKNISVSTAESCTGGLLAAEFTAVSGISKIYKTGLITYSNDSKIKNLKVKPSTIKRYGAVSRQVCAQMCLHLHKISKSQLTFSTTGVAGPNGGTKDKPVGLVYIGLTKRNKTIVSKNYFKKKDRNSIQNKTVEKCIKLIQDII